jgi:hypothetical protein
MSKHVVFQADKHSNHRHAFFTRLSIVVALLLGGCASAQHRHAEIAYHLENPVNCDHAAMDIMTLEDAKASAAEKVANGIATILPTSALLNLMVGEWGSRKAIAFGQFDRKITKKISEIEMSCFSEPEPQQLASVANSR